MSPKTADRETAGAPGNRVGAGRTKRSAFESHNYGKAAQA